jgi:hypothetical protein
MGVYNKGVAESKTNFAFNFCPQGKWAITPTSAAVGSCPAQVKNKSEAGRLSGPKALLAHHLTDEVLNLKTDLPI